MINSWNQHYNNKKHLKNVGPICHCEPFYIAIHQVSLLSHATCASMSTTTTTTTRDRGDRYSPIEWAQWIAKRPTSAYSGFLEVTLNDDARGHSGQTRDKSCLEASTSLNTIFKDCRLEFKDFSKYFQEPHLFKCFQWPRIVKTEDKHFHEEFLKHTINHEKLVKLQI